MTTRNRKRTSKKLKLPKKKYRSKLEEKVSKLLPPDFKYEPYKINYRQCLNRTYLPDFVNEDSRIIVEAKGRFRTFADAQKCVAIDKFLKEAGYRFILVFQDWNTKAYPQAKKRQDGSVFSQKEWAALNNIECKSLRDKDQPRCWFAAPKL